VIRAILLKQVAFEQCADESNNNFDRSKVKIPEEILDIICDVNFYWKNELMLKIVKPIADCVGNLEGRDAHIGLVLYEVIVVFRRIMAIPFRYPHFLTSWKKAEVQSAVDHALKDLNQRFVKFMDNDIYVIAFFLTPEFRSIATSIYFNMVDILTKMVKMIRKMKDLSFIQSSTDSSFRPKLLEETSWYASNSIPFNRHTGSNPRDVFEYWRFMEKTGLVPVLCSFALRVFSLVFHSAPVETLFSTLGNIKSPKRNKMMVKI
jgi:hypothetical protein